MTITLAKVSILMFYLRAFEQPTIRKATHWVLIFVIVINTTLLVVQLFQCIPFKADWTVWDGSYSEQYYCINLNRFTIAGATLNILQELIIMVLPIPAVVRLSVPFRSKITATIMFSLGILTVITSSIRLAYIVPVDDLVNISWDYTNVIIWSGIEAALTVIIPCLPPLRALIKYRGAPLDDMSAPILRQRPDPRTGKSALCSAQ